jgi:hypothetical protein
MAGADLTAMGIESFFLCSLLILLGLGKSEESKKSQLKALPWCMVGQLTVYEIVCYSQTSWIRGSGP